MASATRAFIIARRNHGQLPPILFRGDREDLKVTRLLDIMDKMEDCNKAQLLQKNKSREGGVIFGGNILPISR